MTSSTTSELPVTVTKAYDLFLWLVTHVAKFPRSHKFVLGDRLQSRMLMVVELLIQAAYSKDKRNVLQQANLELQVVKVLIRAGKDLGVTSLRQYEHAAKELVVLGQQIGGWVRSQPMTS